MLRAVLTLHLLLIVREITSNNYVSIKRLRGGDLCLVLLLGARFELLVLEGAVVAVLVEAGQQLALADRLQIQIAVVVLAENVREPYYLPRLLTSLNSTFYYPSYRRVLEHKWLPQFLSTFTM